jgi:hypothetical protein
MFINTVITGTKYHKFKLGQIVATPGAIEKFDPDFITKCLERHANGDWGDLCEEDREQNEIDLKHGGRLMSVYNKNGEIRYSESLWIVTEHDRSATTILLPSEY